MDDNCVCARLIWCVSAVSFKMMPDKDDAFSTGVRCTLGDGGEESERSFD